MRMKTLTAAIVLAGLAPASAYAVLGFGDVSFDPQLSAQMSEMIKTATDTYKVAKGQLDEIIKVQNAIREANATYNDIVNTDLNRMAKEMFPSTRGFGTDPDKLRALRAELERAESAGGANASYAKYQLERVKNLERLAGLQDANSKNVETSTANLDARKSAQVTAQSTATLAALATLQEQRAQQENLAATQASKENQDLMTDSAKLYGALKTSPTNGR